MKIFTHRCVLWYLWDLSSSSVSPLFLILPLLSFTWMENGCMMSFLFSYFTILFPSFFSFFLFRFSSFSFPSHASFIHTLSFQTLISPSTANGLVDMSKKERKIRKWTSVKRNSVHSDGWTVLILIHSFISSFICFLACLYVCFHHNFEQWWRGRATSLSSSLISLSEKKMRNDIAFYFFSSLSSS